MRHEDMTTTIPFNSSESSGKSDRQASSRAHAALLCDMKLPLSQMFSPLGFPVEFRTNDIRILEAAEESFGHTDTRYEDTGLQICVGVTEDGANEYPQEPVRRAYAHLYSLFADRNNQAMLDLEAGVNFTWLSGAALKNRLYVRHNFLEKVVYLLLGSCVVTDLHAGCVSRKGKGILLCGDSGAGKSTLSYACARAGWTYTSDDTCYLINALESPRVVGHAHRVRFRPAARQLFPELEHHAITPRMEGKASIEVRSRDLPPMVTSEQADVSAVVYLKRNPNQTGTLVQLPHGSATERMCDELYSTGSIRVKHQRILDRFIGIPSYELHYCTLEDAIRELEKLTDEL